MRVRVKSQFKILLTHPHDLAFGNQITSLDFVDSPVQDFVLFQQQG
jgi:hypothetical protein